VLDLRFWQWLLWRAIFGAVTPSTLVEVHRRFGARYLPHLQAPEVSQESSALRWQHTQCCFVWLKFRHWKWTWYDPPKRRYASIEELLHGVIIQKTERFIVLTFLYAFITMKMNKMQTFTPKQRSFATHSRFLHNFSLNRLKQGRTGWSSCHLMVKLWSSVAQRWGYRCRITVYDFIAEVYGEGTKI
jgi:hypothetical protein